MTDEARALPSTDELLAALAKWCDEDDRADALEDWNLQGIESRQPLLPLDLVLLLAHDRLAELTAEVDRLRIAGDEILGALLEADLGEGERLLRKHGRQTLDAVVFP